MGSEWRDVNIEWLANSSKGSIAIGPFGSRMKSDCYVDDGIPVIRGTNLTGGKKFEGNFVFISEDKADTLGSCNVWKDDLVFPHRGSIGEVGIVSEDRRYVLSSSMMKLTCDAEKADANFVYYFFKSHAGRFELLKNASQVGTPGIGQPLTSLRSIVLKLPPISDQKAIANLLGTLDDKIELNRQTNQTLEAMAQALFKSWFVDFDLVIDNALAAGNEIPEPLKGRAAARKALGDAHKPLPEKIRCEFPDGFEFVDQLGWVPEGWEVKKIRDIGKVVTGKTPSKNMENSYSLTGCCFITPSDIDANLFIDNTSRRLSKTAQTALEKSKIPAGSVCITCIGSQMGKVVINSEDAITNQQVNSIVFDDPVYRSILALNMRLRRDELRRLGSSGSTMPIVNKSMFENIDFLMPTYEVVNSYSKFVQPLLDKMLHSQSHNTVLTATRDTLLPKLLSGQLTIPDAEKLVADAL